MKKAMIIIPLVLIILVFSFFADDIFGEQKKGNEAEKEEIIEIEKATPKPSEALEVLATPSPSPSQVIQTEEPALSPSPTVEATISPVIPSETPETPVPTAEVKPEVTPEITPSPTPSNEVIEGEEYACSIYIDCLSITENWETLNETQKAYIPENGWIFGLEDCVFYGGESVFDVLKRVCKDNGIHFEFEETPVYNSAYIEGISNIYEFDFGALSGWVYSVNYWFPNYGVSQYKLKANDVISIRYTCDGGEDTGGSNFA